MTQESPAPGSSSDTRLFDERGRRGADLEDRVDRLEEQVTAAVATIEAALPELTSLRTTVEAALAAQARRVERAVGDARQSLVEAADSQVSTVADLGQQILARLSAAAASEDDRLDGVRAAVGSSAAPIEALTGALEAVHGDVESMLEAGADDRRTVRELAERVAELSTRVDEGLARATEVVTGHGQALDEAIAGVRDGVAGDVDGLREQLRSTVRVLGQELRDAVAVAGEHFAGDTERQVQELRTAVDAAGATVSQRLQSVVAGLELRLDRTEERLDGVIAGFETAERTLAQDLEERRRQVAVERAALTQQFAEQLVDGLSRRERRRLVRRFEVPEPASELAFPPKPPAVPPRAHEPSVPHELEDEPTDETGSSSTGGPTDTSGPPAPDAPDAPDTPDEPGPPPVPDATPAPSGRRRARVVPSRASRPVRPAASAPRDPAAMRRILASVRGLGPAKQSALIDAFGSIESLREASDDQLLEVTGIGPALLQPIRDAVR